MKFPEEYRIQEPEHPWLRSKPGNRFGSFLIPGNAAHGRVLNVIAYGGGNIPGFPEVGDWEHVSVSVYQAHGKRLPSWAEMCAVKSLFWDTQECVVQFHPAQEEYVNIRPGVLHLWRFTEGAFPTPPVACV